MDNLNVKKKVKRVRIKEGDVFYAEIGNGEKAYFQYIMQDHHQLGGHVIRVFDRHYKLDMQPEISEIVKDKVAFYTHVFLFFGIKEEAYNKVGNSTIKGNGGLDNVYFGHTHEFHYPNPHAFEPPIEVNPLENWFVWKVTGEKKNLRKVPEEIIPRLEYCAVMPTKAVINRMRLGYFLDTGVDYEVIRRHPRPEVNSFTKRVETDIIRYSHFLGEYAIREVVTDMDGYVIARLEKGENRSGQYRLREMPFYETNWQYNEFLTEEDFEKVWNSGK